MWSQEMKNGRVQFFKRYEDPLTGKKKVVSVTADKLTNATKKSAQDKLRRKIAERMDISSRKATDTLQNVLDAYAAHQECTLKPDTADRRICQLRRVPPVSR